MALMAGKKLRSLGVHGLEGTYEYMFWCPGCRDAHGIPIKESPSRKVIWGFNGNVEKPTFTPSILARWTRLTAEGERMIKEKIPLAEGQTKYPSEDIVCHSFVTDGMIQFLSDSNHELSGQTVPIPDWPENENWDDASDGA